MGKADGLSRRVDWKVGTDKDNDNQIFIKDNWIRNMYEVVVEGPEVDILEKIKKARSKDEDVKIADGGLYFICSLSFLFYFSFLFLLIFYF